MGQRSYLRGKSYELVVHVLAREQGSDLDGGAADRMSC